MSNHEQEHIMDPSEEGTVLDPFHPLFTEVGVEGYVAPKPVSKHLVVNIEKAAKKQMEEIVIAPKPERSQKVDYVAPNNKLKSPSGAPTVRDLLNRRDQLN